MRIKKIIAAIMCCLLLTALGSICWARAQAQDYVEYPTAEDIPDDIFMQLALWDTLDDDSKQQVLQGVSDIEAINLGVQRLEVIIDSTLPDQTIACYCDDRHRISVNSSYLDNMEQATVGVCHEARHALHHAAADALDNLSEAQKRLVIFKDIEQIRRELNSYIHGSDDLLGYYQQVVEIDSRSYAEERFNTFYLAHLPAVS